MYFLDKSHIRIFFRAVSLWPPPWQSIPEVGQWWGVVSWMECHAPRPKRDGSLSWFSFLTLDKSFWKLILCGSWVRHCVVMADMIVDWVPVAPIHVACRHWRLTNIQEVQGAVFVHNKIAKLVWRVRDSFPDTWNWDLQKVLVTRICLTPCNQETYTGQRNRI